MAEISYPFAASNSSGGSQMVSQAQWQKMARMFGGDRIDFQLTATSYGVSDLPFLATVVNGRQIAIQPGRAKVGGFYYEMSTPITLTVPDNSGSNPRIDLVVLRLDMATSAVTATLSIGQAAASPVAPTPTRALGGQWELPIWVINSPAKSGAISLSSALACDMPQPVAAPWNAAQVGGLVPVGTYVTDMDNNTDYSQTESFRSRDGYVPTRTLGKSLTWTPSITNPNAASASGNTAASKSGRYRFIAPNLAWFSATYATGSVAVTTGTNAALGITLPVPACGKTGQLLKGVLYNLAENNGLPNICDVSVVINKGSSQSAGYMIFPSTVGVAYGMDNLTVIPKNSTLTLSGTYEANFFNE